MTACGSRWVGGEAGISGECRGGGMSGGFGAGGHAHTIRRVHEARPAVGVTGVVRQQVPSQPRGVHWHVTEPGRPPAELVRRIQHRERLVTNPRQPPAGLVGRIQHGQRGVRRARSCRKVSKRGALGSGTLVEQACGQWGSDATRGVGGRREETGGWRGSSGQRGDIGGGRELSHLLRLCLWHSQLVASGQHVPRLARLHLCRRKGSPPRLNPGGHFCTRMRLRLHQSLRARGAEEQRVTPPLAPRAGRRVYPVGLRRRRVERAAATPDPNAGFFFAPNGEISRRDAPSSAARFRTRGRAAGVSFLSGSEGEGNRGLGCLGDNT
eukprot:scaffold2946_cov90-Isochrysis_galbana.AAC.2